MEELNSLDTHSGGKQSSFEIRQKLRMFSIPLSVSLGRRVDLG